MDSRLSALVPALAASALLHGLGGLAVDALVPTYDPNLTSAPGHPPMSAHLVQKVAPDGRPSDARNKPPDGNEAAPAAAKLEDSRTLDLQDRGPLSLSVPGEPYYSALEVDRRISALTPVELNSEQLNLLAPHATGKIQIKLWIDKSGKVNKAEILKADLPQPVADLAVSVFAHTRFQPAMRQGKPVNAVSVIEIDYADEPANRTFPPNVPSPPQPVPSATGN